MQQYSKSIRYIDITAMKGENKVKKVVKKTTAIAMLSATLFGMYLHPLNASTISFNDVSPSFWGYSNIQWAIENKIVDGYLDGSFKPNQNVEQAEFIAMLIRAFQPSDFDATSETGEWSISYIRYANKMGWNVITPSSLGGHKSYIYLNRGMAAKLLVNATGKNFSMDDSIQYLLDIGLAKGKTDTSIEGFKKGDEVTRAEAITFIQRLKQVISNLQSTPSTEKIYIPQTSAREQIKKRKSRYAKPTERRQSRGKRGVDIYKSIRSNPVTFEMVTRRQ